MEIFDKTFKEILSSQILSIIGGLIAGSLLAIYTNKLLLIPSILIILPGFLELRGSVSGSFASRLSSGLFLHVINPRKQNTKIIKGNILSSFLLTILVSFVLGIIAFLITYLILNIVFFPIVFLAIIASIISNIIEIPITLFTTFHLYKKGHDPNNIMGPFITTIADITSVLSLLIALVIII